MINIQLSRNFNLFEFFVSEQYPDIAKAMSPNNYEIETLRLLCDSCLQYIRDKIGAIKILSGYRSPQLNTLIGGSATSDHMSGNAADFTPLDTDNILKAFDFCKTLPYRQLIYYPAKKFIHISINVPGKQYKHEILLK